jgi:hypothetical protein
MAFTNPRRASCHRCGVLVGARPSGVLDAVGTEVGLTGADAGDFRRGEHRKRPHGVVDRLEVVPEEIAGHRPHLAVGAVLQEVLADDIAERPDAVGARPEVSVDLDEAAGVRLDARRLDVEGVGVRTTTGRDQQPVARDLDGAVVDELRPAVVEVVSGDDSIPRRIESASSDTSSLTSGRCRRTRRRSPRRGCRTPRLARRSPSRRRGTAASSRGCNRGSGTSKWGKARH